MTTQAQARRVLVVTNGENHALPEAIHERVTHTRAEVLVVTPLAGSRFRHWLSDVDGGHRVAEERVCRSVEELRRSGFDAEGIVGDADPALAISDALAVFDADVLVVDDELASYAGGRHALPIVPVHAAA
jgi:hypothetical protein